MADLPDVEKGAIVLISDPVPALVARAARTAPSALILVQLRPGQMMGFAEVESLRHAGATAIFAAAYPLSDLTLLMDAARIASSRAQGQIGPRLRLLARPISADFEFLLEVLIESPPGSRASDWAAAVGESVRTLERCAMRSRVPSPRRWIQLVRVIQAVQAVQARPRDSVESVLARSGFQNVRGTRELVAKICGASPGRVRALIGWYWILERWCRISWKL